MTWFTTSLLLLSGILFMVAGAMELRRAIKNPSDARDQFPSNRSYRSTSGPSFALFALMIFGTSLLVKGEESVNIWNVATVALFPISLFAYEKYFNPIRLTIVAILIFAASIAAATVS